jgi:hypothetical protein
MIFRDGKCSELTEEISSDERTGPTVVLTHGWVFPPFWYDGINAWKPFAQQIFNVMRNSGHPITILGWHWPQGALGLLPPEQKTTRQGQDLGNALYNALGSSYSGRIHFIGHSLGALVNASAANFLHGDKYGNESVASPVWDWQKTELTLLDEAEIARFVSPKLLDKALKEAPTLAAGLATDPTGGASAMLDLAFSIALDYAKDALNTRKSPLSMRYGWADNYVSFFGFNYDQIATVCLRKSLAVNLTFPSLLSQYLTDGLGDVAALFDGVAGAHSYSLDWYSKTVTINNLMKPVHLGFYDSFEYSMVNPYSFPDSSLSKTFWEQDQSSVDEFALLQVPSPPPLRLDCNCLGRVLVDATLRHFEFAGDALTALPGAAKVVGNIYLDEARTTVDLWANTYNYVEAKADQGYNKVVDLGSDTILRLTLKSSTLAPHSALRASATQSTLTEGTSAIVLPVSIPVRALFVQFDYIVSGDINDDFLFFGINETTPVNFDGKFIPTNIVQTSQPFDVIGLAGTTNNIVFGLSGGTSTGCTVTIQGIRFLLDDPALTIGQENGQPVLSWPADAANWDLEMAETIPAGEWVPTLSNPTLVGGSYRLQPIVASRKTVFYRLRRN